MTRSKKSSQPRRNPGGKRHRAQHPSVPRPNRTAARVTRPAIQFGGIKDPILGTQPTRASLRAYADILMRPFSAPLTGVPIYPSVQSVKVRVIQRGKFFTGTGDYIGWVAVGPAFGNGTINFKATTAATVNGDGFAGGSAVAIVNHPYAANQFGTNALLGRMVTCALRIRNVTPKLNRAGSAYLLQEPDGNDLTTGSRSPTIAQAPIYENQGCWHAADPNGEWSTLHFRKTEMLQFDYSGTSSAPNTAPTCLAAYIEGAASFAQTYEYEVVNVYEITGSLNNAPLPGVTQDTPHPLATLVDQHTNAVHSQSSAMQNSLHTSAHSDIVAKCVETGKSLVDTVEAVANAANKYGPRIASAFERAGGFIGL